MTPKTFSKCQTLCKVRYIRYPNIQFNPCMNPRRLIQALSPLSRCRAQCSEWLMSLQSSHTHYHAETQTWRAWLRPFLNAMPTISGARPTKAVLQRLCRCEPMRKQQQQPASPRGLFGCIRRRVKWSTSSHLIYLRDDSQKPCARGLIQCMCFSF